MSALPPIADMCSAKRDVRFVPIADIGEYDRLSEIPPGSWYGKEKTRSGCGDVPNVIKAVPSSVTRFGILGPSV